MARFRSNSLSNNSSRAGTAISAAAVGVGALLSETKSAIVVSVSCPTALIIGIRQENIARATDSSLNAHRSSIEPPPRPTMSTSMEPYASACSIDLTMEGAACASLYNRRK